MIKNDIFPILNYRYTTTMSKVRRHIDLSNNIIRCKNCKCLKMIRYLDDILCEKCEKEYRHILHNIKNA